MLQFAVATLLAISFAVVLDLRGTDAAPISADLYLSQFCIGCTAPVNNTVTSDLDWLINIKTTKHDFMACSHDRELYCKNFDDNLANETETEIKKSLNTQLASEIANLQNLAEYRPEYKESAGCSYFESKVRDPRRVREECNDVEPSPDHLELRSVLTLTTILMISFVVLAGVWLLHRSFRNWQLRKMIPRDKTTARLQIVGARRRASGLIRR
jgi:hypothetical protein